MLSKETQRALISEKPDISTIIKAKFKIKHFRIKLDVIECYHVPTNVAVEEIKELSNDK